MRFIGVGLVAAGTLAGLAVGPTVRLRPDEVEVPIGPEELLTLFRRRFADADDGILANQGNRVVRRFEGKAGPFPFRTVELVSYDSAGITFDHLAGPFSYCHERFGFEATSSGTRLVHTGSFRLRGGLWTAPLALTGVRQAFEDHVREHLLALVRELAPGVS